MEKKMVNVRDMALYFDGANLYPGEVQSNKYDERVFVNKEQNFGIYLNEENTNVDFVLGKPAVMILREAIEENAYGKDRNLGLENAGLDEMENQYINKMYEIGEIEYGEFYKAVLILGQKISTRLRSFQAQSDFSIEFNKLHQLVNEESSEQ